MNQFTAGLAKMDSIYFLQVKAWATESVTCKLYSDKRNNMCEETANIQYLGYSSLSLYEFWIAWQYTSFYSIPPTWYNLR